MYNIYIYEDVCVLCLPSPIYLFITNSRLMFTHVFDGLICFLCFKLPDLYLTVNLGSFSSVCNACCAVQ